MKLLPVTVMLKLPVETLCGATPTIAGLGLSRVTDALPLAEALAELTACTVTALGLGRACGAV